MGNRGTIRGDPWRNWNRPSRLWEKSERLVATYGENGMVGFDCGRLWNNRLRPMENLKRSVAIWRVKAEAQNLPRDALSASRFKSFSRSASRLS